MTLSLHHDVTSIDEKLSGAKTAVLIGVFQKQSQFFVVNDYAAYQVAKEAIRCVL